MPYGQSFRKLPGSIDRSTLAPYDPATSGPGANPAPSQPDTSPTPFGTFQQEFRSRGKTLQGNYLKQWNAIRAQERKLGPDRMRQMLAQLDQQVQKEAASLQQEFDTKKTYFNQIQSLSDAGLISNGNELLWKAAVGDDAARAMFPRQASTIERLQEADRAARLLEGEMSQWQEVPATPNRWWGTGAKNAGIVKWDPEANAGKGGYAKTRVQDPKEIAYYEGLKRLHKQNQTMKEALVSGGPFSKVAAKLAMDPAGHSTFSDKVLGTKIINSPPERKPSRSDMLAEYKRLGGKSTAEGRAFADQYLR